MIDKTIANHVFDLLKEKKLTVATAESCTGGLIAHSLTNISGSSDIFDRGVVSYSNESKMELLDVSKELLDKYGAVSPQVANSMAEGMRKKSNVDIAVSTTGIAGPTGGSKDKPVGLVYIGVSSKNETIVEKKQFKKDRIGNKEETCNAALKILIQVIGKI